MRTGKDDFYAFKFGIHTKKLDPQPSSELTVILPLILRNTSFTI
jgi:hypothetical protein